MEEITRNAIIKRLGEKLHEKLNSNEEGGCPQLSEDARRFKQDSVKFYLTLVEVQALLDLTGQPNLVPVIPNGKCENCIHGFGISSCNLIYDCDGCQETVLHPHFISTLSGEDSDELMKVKREDIYELKPGENIKSKLNEMRDNPNNKFKYYMVDVFVYELETERRLCHARSVGKLHLPADKR